MAADDATIDRAALATDLERARVEFHRLLADAERDDLWTASTHGTRWTNEQLLFHMVFGYMVVQRLLLSCGCSTGRPIQSAAVSPASSTPQPHRFTPSTTTAPVRPPWSTTVAGWAQSSIE